MACMKWNESKQTESQQVGERNQEVRFQRHGDVHRTERYVIFKQLFGFIRVLYCSYYTSYTSNFPRSDRENNSALVPFETSLQGGSKPNTSLGI